MTLPDGCVEKDGQIYLIVLGPDGQKRAMLVERFDEAGKPVVKVETIRTPNAQGGFDVTVKVPFLAVQGETKQ